MGLQKIIIGGLVGLFLIIGYQSSHAWSYPLKQVTIPTTECKSLHWSELDDSCKMKLPSIDDADYASYIGNWTVQAIFSDVWGGSYNDGWAYEKGGAPSTDIATSEGTPVYAIGGGKVIFAGELKGYGKSVTIEHDLGKGKKIRSSYSHLSVISVKKGEVVKEGVQIGEVGKTGFTIGPFGNHLDFALTTTKQQSYPYAYRDCKAGYMKAVQEGVCRDLMLKHTIDPILFLELDGNLDKSIKLASARIKASQAKTALLAKENKDGLYKKTLDTAKLAIINQKIYEIKKDNLTIEIVDMQRNESESIGYKGKAYVTVVVKKNGKPYDGYLDKTIAFISKNKTVGIGGGSIDYVKNGEKTVILYGDKKGDDTISVKIGDELVGIHHTKVS
ncbi:MAG TPA: M23 family metallopeptidase [Candidatus Absconditabacterales bacterium]|nr:M23 family metallopeptidase [Candidatus Absconditabacterales bacterium]